MRLLLIGTRQMLQNTPVDLDLHVTLLGKELCLVVSVKDLGVHMDARMSVDEHITSITSSCLSSLSQMNRVKHLLDRNTLLRANVCNFRESVDSLEFLNFFIFCSNNLYSTLISKITLKLVTAFYFFRNLAKFEKL